jgi:hypothetical protein
MVDLTRGGSYISLTTFHKTTRNDFIKDQHQVDRCCTILYPLSIPTVHIVQDILLQ